MGKIRSLGGVSVRSVKEFIADDMTTYAAALAYQIFFALFPFIIFLVALLGLFQVPQLLDFLLNQAQNVLPQSAFSLIEGVITGVSGQAAGGAITFGVVVALYSASAGVRMATHAMNVAYDLEEDRPLWKKFPLSILYTIILAALIIAAVGLMLLGPQIASSFANLVGLGSIFTTLWAWLRLPIAILLLILAFAIIYYLFPNYDHPFRIVTPGAVIAVIVWVLASLAFSFYVENFASYSATYGTIASVIVLLLYFFISGAILLFGAEVNAETDREVEGGQEEGDGKPGAS